jgi:hypothetical protein
MTAEGAEKMKHQVGKRRGRAWRSVGAAVVLTCCAIASDASAQTETAHDGNWWQSQSRPEQLAYVVGLMDGVQDLALVIMLDALPETSAVSEDAAKQAMAAVVRSTTSIVEAIPSSTIGQISDGITEFYKDFRNRRLAAINGAVTVFKQISGTPQAEIDAMLERMRAAVK